MKKTGTEGKMTKAEAVDQILLEGHCDGIACDYCPAHYPEAEGLHREQRPCHARRHDNLLPVNAEQTIDAKSTKWLQDWKDKNARRVGE